MIKISTLAIDSTESL